MFKFLKKKTKKKDDQILEMLNKQTEEVVSIRKGMEKQRGDVEQQIKESEDALRKLGYSEKDLNKLKFKSL